METRIKNYLGIALIIVSFLFAVAALSYVNSYSKSIQPSSFRSFSASGEGKVIAIPDVAQFTFSVLVQGGKNIADLQKENVEKTNAAIAFVKSNGVDEKDVKTQSYNLEPRYQYYSCPSEKNGPCPPPEIIGYTVTRTVLVKIRNFEKIGTVLSGVVENGANSVSQLSFTIDDPAELQSKARTEAIRAAREKAAEVAKAADFRIGRLLSADEGGGYIPPYYASYGARLLKESAPAPTIEPGSQEVKVTVTLKYEIE